MSNLDENNKLEETESKPTSYEVETNSINYASYSFFETTQNSSSLSMDSLLSYIRYPMIHNAILREISKQCYNANGQYARAVDIRVSMPLLSYVLVGRNKDLKKKKERKKKQQLDLMLKFMNHTKTTRDILRKLDIDGMYVGILRDTVASNKGIVPLSGIIESTDRLEGLSLNDNFMIQPLDLDYCKIIGFQNNVQIAAFDMQYFDQFDHGGLLNEIKNFPKEFMKAFMNYKKDVAKRWYVLDYRTTIVIAARSNIDEAYGRPYGLAALANMKSQSDYISNQYKIIQELASSIYVLLLPPGEKTGTCSLNQKQQDAVIEAFKGAVRSNTTGNQAKISTLSLPPGAKIDRITKDSSLLKDTLNDENIKKISTDLGFASSALNAASEGSSSFAGIQVNLDMISSQIFELLGYISDEFTRVLNEHEGIRPSDYIDIKYLPISHINKNEMYSKMKDLYTLAGGSRTYMIACTGISPYDYYAICDDERDENMDDKYPPHITAYNLSDSADKQNPSDNIGGRPQKEDKDLSLSGIKTKATGANDIIKPSTK